VIADVLQEEGYAVAADIYVSQGRATFVRTDVTLEVAWKNLIATTIATYGRLDILVNNAGIRRSSVGDEFAQAGWDKRMAVNATSVFLGITRAASEMAKAGGGSIINISSIMGFIGGSDSHPGYGTSRGVVRILTQTVAVRFGPTGVRVNSVHPGYLPMLHNTNAAGRASKLPLRRLGEVMHVAYGVLFLASDEASFFTGTELVIDGGYIAQ
jgi:NAD(P)-dependent dehydrogenase (short-subunit alcohol dehydrogenase family)